MSTPTYTLINQITLAAASSAVTFSSIPQNYKDLVLVINGNTPGAGDLRAVLNADTGSNYSFVQMSSDGSSAFSSAAGNTFMIFTFTLVAGATVMVANLMDYSAIDKHKTCISRGDQGAGRTMAYATRWANTAAINSMAISHAAGNLATGTTFSLYGIVG